MVLTEEQRAFQDIARRFAQERLAPGYMAREQEAMLDPGLVQEMGRLGLIGPDLPAEFGGIDASGVVSGIIMEEVACGDFNVGYVQLLASLVGGMMVRHAPTAVVADWVPRIVAGSAIVGLALTEPRGGSDAANLALRAERRGDHFVLSGEKNSISFADQADAFVVFARTGGTGGGAHGVSAFFVPADSPGLSRMRLNCIGSKLIGRGSLFFDDVAVPAENMMGRENAGFVQVMQGFDYSRALIGLQCVGAAQASLDEAWEYTQQRQAFGGPIAQYQGVTFPLAEGDTIIAAARQLCYHTLSLRDAGMAHTAEAAMCKWLAPKSAVDVIHQCLLTFGHYGWTMDTPHQQRLRDVMGLEIGDGTAQIMKLVIARERVGRVAVQYTPSKARDLTMSDASPVLVERDGAVGIILLNRPDKFNCLSMDVTRRITAALDGFEADGSVRALLIASEGKQFCTGADLQEVEGLRHSHAELATFIATGHAALCRLESSPLPVVAAVQGLALAGGLELMMACDIAFAASSAKFGDQHSQFGLIPGWGGSQRLPRLVGMRRAMDLFFSAAWIDASTAKEWGLVNRVVKDNALRNDALAYCRTLTERSRSGLATMKRLARQGIDLPLTEALQLEQQLAPDALMSPDVSEGLAAFKGRRKPDFV